MNSGNHKSKNNHFGLDLNQAIIHAVQNEECFYDEPHVLGNQYWRDPAYGELGVLVLKAEDNSIGLVTSGLSTHHIFLENDNKQEIKAELILELPVLEKETIMHWLKISITGRSN